MFRCDGYALPEPVSETFFLLVVELLSSHLISTTVWVVRIKMDLMTDTSIDRHSPAFVKISRDPYELFATFEDR
jgi:hypothetical protein